MERKGLGNAPNRTRIPLQFGAERSQPQIIRSSTTQQLVPTFSTRIPVWYVAGTLSVGSQQSARFFADKPWKPNHIFAHSRIAPSGGQVLIDIKIDNTSVFGSLPYITTGTIYNGDYVFGLQLVPSGAKLSLDINQVGSSHAGEDLTCQMTCRLE